MASEVGGPVAAPPAATGELPGEGVGPALTQFWRRIAERTRPDDVAALLVDECFARHGCRRAFYAAVQRDGNLAIRFASGFEGLPHVRMPLTAEEMPLVAAVLSGRVATIDHVQLLASGIPGGALLDPVAYGVAVPLVALPLTGGSKGDLQPHCPLHRLEPLRSTRCFLQKAPNEDPQIPPWEVRLQNLCPECPAFGATGLVFAERERRFSPAELEQLALLGHVAGQRSRALDTVARLERVAEKMRKDREWLDTIMVSAADPIVVTDSTGMLVLQNRRAEEVLVATSDDSPGRRRAISINDIMFSAYLSSLGMDPKRAPRELPLVHPVDGSDLLFEAISTPAFGASGQRIGMVTVLRDITDLQKATQELLQQVYKAQHAELKTRQERDRLNVIVQSAVEPIVVTNPANEIVLTNAEGERLFQAAPSDPEARQKAIRHNDAFFSSFLSEFMTDLGQQRKRELRLVDPASDEVRSFEVTAGKVRDERGQAVGVVSVFHDLTRLRELERRRIEQKLFESEKLAAAGRLAASIAHEMNNPLQSIKNSLFILKPRIPDSDPAARFVEIAHKECDRVSNIIKQFLGFYRPTATMLPVQPAAILEDELRLVENQLQKRRIAVVRATIATPPVLANEDQLKQVFLNLILNAIEAMPEGGTLTISTRYDAHATAISAIAPSVRVTIGDSGTGISPEHMSQIFEPFFTTKTGPDETGKGGTGLGLSACHKIIVAHGGRIRVESTVGIGTQFTIKLPQAKRSAEPVAPV